VRWPGRSSPSKLPGSHTIACSSKTIRCASFGLALHPGQHAFVKLLNSFMTVPWQDVEIIIGDDGKSAIQRFQVHRGEASFKRLPQKNQGSSRWLPQ
jgi:hypothetical protein